MNRHEKTPTRSISYGQSSGNEMFEGMKIMFDEKVGLYPVTLTEEDPPRQVRNAD